MTARALAIPATRLPGCLKALTSPSLPRAERGRQGDIAEVLTSGKADAALAASIFHFGEISIGNSKDNCGSRGFAYDYKRRATANSPSIEQFLLPTYLPITATAFEHHTTRFRCADSTNNTLKLCNFLILIFLNVADGLLPVVVQDAVSLQSPHAGLYE